MENANIDARFRAYLDGTMTSRERRAFEEELKRDTSLQKAFLITALQEQKSVSPNETRIRAVAERLRETNAPLPIPKITWINHLRIHRRLVVSIAAVFIGILFIAPAVWVNIVKPLPAISELPANFIQPAELGVAGDPGDTSYTAARSIFERSSDFYWKKRAGGLDSLMRVAASCSGFCMARYYLAHWYLEHRQFDLARTEFEACLANKAYLQKFSETRDIDKLRFNALLAELGASGKSEKVMTGLKALLNETPATSAVHKQAQDVYDELTNPLRFFSFQ